MLEALLTAAALLAGSQELAEAGQTDVEATDVGEAHAKAADTRGIVVRGIVASADPSRSTAIFQAGGLDRVAGVGEAIFGGRVVAIEPGRVTLDFAGREVELRLAGSVTRTAEAPRQPPSAAEPRPVEATEATMERAEVHRRLGIEMSRILSETRLRPVREGGSVRGFALDSLPAGTLLTDVGLQPGDVLTDINGVALDGMATLVSLWPRLQSARELRATVLRDGRPLTVVVTLR